ncbi:hypothetical protein BDU57DRAFT_509787 [Ampelomyces quisqualis]|uniref:Uncharacterized protein n=1 Tax=Ampelomyces quisqualis TaxID=50730 RepID=A0A6A5R1Y3_AMPQU|nr:hypothetical protein BDU57DRAFT_509787 [Ampelomyces quisqualis]
MGNLLTRLTHHKSHPVHQAISQPKPIPPYPISANKTPPTPNTTPAHQPRQHSFPRVPEAVVAATEQGMICENMGCASLSSSALR